MKARSFDLLGAYAIERGFAWRFVFRRLQPNRQPVDLTGLSCRIEIYDTQKARQTPVAFDCERVLDAGGEVAFNLTGVETRDIAATAGRYRIIFTDASGEETVFLRGRLAILEPWQ